MNQSPKRAVLLWAALAIPIIWLAILLAGCCGEGVNLFDWMAAVTVAMDNPFALHFNQYTKKVVLMALLAYGFAVAMYYAEKGNRRIGVEYGSAKWYPASQINRLLRTRKNDRYIRLSKNISLSMNTWKLPIDYQLNPNVMVVGGSGSGKT